jgi:hypothetical protein
MAPQAVQRTLKQPDIDKFIKPAHHDSEPVVPGIGQMTFIYVWQGMAP